MFDGNARKRATVSMRGRKEEDKKEDILRRARLEREQRAAERERTQAASVIQRTIRSRAWVLQARRTERIDLEKKLGDLWKLRQIMQAAKQPVPTPTAFLEPLLRQFVVLYDPRLDADRLEHMATLLVESCRSPVAEWNYLTLRYKMPLRFWAESARLIRLCLFHLSFRTPEDEEGGNNSRLPMLVELMKVLLDPTSLPEGLAEAEATTAVRSHWELALTLAGRTCSSMSNQASPPRPGSSLNTFVRRYLCLTVCLQREMARPRGGRPSPLSSQLIQLLAGLVVRVIGMEQGPGDWPPAPQDLRARHQVVSQQACMSLLALPDLLSNPVLVQSFPILAGPGALLLLQAFQESQASLPARPDGGLSSAPQTVELSEIDMLHNLLLISKHVIDKLDMTASVVKPLLHVLQYCSTKIPLDGTISESRVAMAGEADMVMMDVEEEEEEDDETESRAQVLGRGQELDRLIGAELRRKRNRSVRLLSAPMSPAQRRASLDRQVELSGICQHSLQELCSNRLLTKVFSKVLPVGATGTQVDDDMVLTMCKFCCDILVNADPGASNDMAGGSVQTRVLNLLAYHSTTEPLVVRLWRFVRGAAVTLPAWRSSPSTVGTTIAKYQHAFHLLFSVYSHQLMALDDEEFYQRQSPFPLESAAEIAETVKFILYDLFWVTPEHLLPQPNLFRLQFASTAAHLYNQLYQRNSRRIIRSPIGPTLWLFPPVDAPELDADAGEVEGAEGPASIDTIFSRSNRTYLVLTEIPQVLPFNRRVRVFQRLLRSQKSNANGLEGFFFGTRVTIRRPNIFDDSYQNLNPLGSNLKNRIQVTFVNEHGVEEAGIDGGGVFKEFMDTLTKRAFDGDMFKQTADHLLFPNPLSEMAYPADHLSRFEFLGRILGKALLESILVEPQFALFFLQRLVGKLNEVDDLYLMDPELYRNLMSLKAIKAKGGDVADLSLNFEVVTKDQAGRTKSTELVPNGKSIPVINENVFRYIQLVANFKLNVEIDAQVRAFLRGFRDLIPLAWLRMFGAEELQLLLGGQKRALDIDDMKANTAYGGGYHPSQPPIQWFWDILSSFTPDQQAAFLTFVTSCSRQPLLGFSQLTPHFCIHRVPINADSGDRLPTSATCMNLLKLPAYSSKETMREKLLYSITSGAGFELS